MLACERERRESVPVLNCTPRCRRSRPSSTTLMPVTLQCVTHLIIQRTRLRRQSSTHFSRGQNDHAAVQTRHDGMRNVRTQHANDDVLPRQSTIDARPSFVHLLFSGRGRRALRRCSGMKPGQVSENSTSCGSSYRISRAEMRSVPNGPLSLLDTEVTRALDIKSGDLGKKKCST